MAQFLKDEVQARIADAALTVFATKGYADASIAEIARAAVVSTGNVYRYYENKQVLFDEVVPESLARSLRSLLRERVSAARGEDDLGRLGPASAYVLASSSLMDFTLRHRREVLILLGRAEGTRHARLATELKKELVELALAHAASLSPPRAVSPTTRFALERVYEGFLAAHVAILASYTDERDIRAAVTDFGRYHLAGLAQLFG